MSLNILIIGDIVGSPGRTILKEKLPSFTKDQNIDFVIANGENAAGGSGITPEVLHELTDAGVDAVTTGDHVWRKKEIMSVIDSNPRILRPANLPDSVPGRGARVFSTRKGVRIGVINLLGRVFMNPVDCPFRAVERAIAELALFPPIIVVDFHAEATSEKIAMGWFLNGRVSFVCGTHTHVATADERILSKGTAYITDIGMTGPHESVLGRRIDRVLRTFITGLPSHFDVAGGDVRLCGAVATIDSTSGKALDVKRVVLHGSM